MGGTNVKHKVTGDREMFGSGSTNPAVRYRDGRPIDTVQYLEAKLILKPDRFTSVECFRDFGKRVQSTAKELGVPFTVSPRIDDSPEIWEIVFGDTADYSLYRHGFILRRRIRYSDGFPEGDPEVVLKFRHSDELTAAAVDVRPNIAGKCRIKFKMEELPLKNEVGGLRFLYSHNCVLPLSTSQQGDDISMVTLSRVFPALARLQERDGEKVTIVHDTVVEEVYLELGQLKFGKGMVAGCNVALWRTRGEHQPLVGEFAYQVKFNPTRRVREKAMKLCEQFFISLQFEVRDWIFLGQTKTEMVYHMDANSGQGRECGNPGAALASEGVTVLQPAG